MCSYNSERIILKIWDNGGQRNSLSYAKNCPDIEFEPSSKILMPLYIYYKYSLVQRMTLDKMRDGDTIHM